MRRGTVNAEQVNSSSRSQPTVVLSFVAVIALLLSLGGTNCRAGEGLTPTWIGYLVAFLAAAGAGFLYGRGPSPRSRRRTLRGILLGLVAATGVVVVVGLVLYYAGIQGCTS